LGHFLSKKAVPFIVNSSSHFLFKSKQMPFLNYIATTCLFLGSLTSNPVAGYKIHKQNGSLHYDNGQLMMVKGASWFGKETKDSVVNGLWVKPMKFYMDLLATEKFNVIRVPFCSKWILHNFDIYPDQGFVSADPDNQNKKSIEILDTLFDMAHERNMLILLDLHRLNCESIGELWYDPFNGDYTDDTFFETWFKILDRYKNHKALWGIDLLNEPHGPATWGSGDRNTDWRQFAEFAIHKFEERYVGNRWIYLVEGIEWGKNLANVEAQPIVPPDSASDRLVYSAHNYGKSVVPSIDVYNVQALYDDWDSHFGYLSGKEVVIIGEWGGRVDLDAEWMKTFVAYLQERKMTNTFFWSLQCNSGDVAGFLLDDWVTVDSFKRDVTTRLQPDPVPLPVVPSN
jgi:endoglucanase